MSRNVRNRIASLLTAATLALVPFAIPAAAAAQVDISGNLCNGATLTVTNTSGCASTGNAGQSVDNFITDLVNIFSIVVGVVAVIMIIIGGFRYITSNGDSNNISGAKNTIIYAIIGLVIVALAQFIVQFVLGRVGNLTSGG